MEGVGRSRDDLSSLIKTERERGKGYNIIDIQTN